jgi:tetratricopeptide (TPR) repeat protein
MTSAQNSADRPEGLSLSDLFTQYLTRQAAAQAQGLGYAEATDEIVPYDAAPVQPVDPRLAWDDAVAAAKYLADSAQVLSVPPEWPTLVALQEPAVAVAFCLGNYPQMVRNLHPLLAGDLMALRVPALRPLSIPAVVEWAGRLRSGPQMLLAASVLRLAGQFEQAQAALTAAELPVSLHRIRDNELAAIAWHRGRAEEALDLWQTQEPRAPVLFNRGMALLFLGRTVEAQDALTQAVSQIPETNAWHHLGQVYLALTGERRS